MTSFAAALSSSDADAVEALAAAAARADAVAPLSEQSLLQLRTLDAGVRHLLLRDERGETPLLAGYARLDQVSSAELVVDPRHRRRGVGTRLLAALQDAAGQALQVWAHGDLPPARALAESHGFVRSRVLLQLQRSLTGPLPEPVWPEGVGVRTFRPGADEDAWLAVNAAAFATHPEQGRWTRADLEQREAQDWFDPGGFFLAERDGEVLGFHWTKVHAEDVPPLGEVYVVGVAPAAAGRRLGPALTLAGLHYLRDRGLSDVMLYVDEDNAPATRLYARLGFHRRAADVMYTPGTSAAHR